MKRTHNFVLLICLTIMPAKLWSQQISLTPTVLDSHPTIAEFRDEISRADIVARGTIVKILRRREGKLGDEDIIFKPSKIYKGAFDSDFPCVRLEFYQSLEWKEGARLPDTGAQVILPLDIVHPYTGAQPLAGEKVHYFAKFYYTVSEDGNIASIFGFPEEMREHTSLEKFEKLIISEINKPVPEKVEFTLGKLLYSDDFDDGSIAGWIFLDGGRGFMEAPHNQWIDETWVGPQSVLRNKLPSGEEKASSRMVYDPKTGVLHGIRNGTPIEIGVFNGRLRMRSGHYWQHITAVTGDPEWTNYQIDLDIYNFNDPAFSGKGDLGQVNYLKFGPYGRVTVPNLPETEGEHSFVSVEFGTFGNYDVSEMTFGNNAFQIRCKYPEPKPVWRDHSVLLRTTRVLDYEPWAIPLEKKIHLTAKYWGRHVEGWIDGKKVLEGIIPADHPGAMKGRIALWAFETWAEFDNIRVRELVPLSSSAPGTNSVSSSSSPQESWRKFIQKETLQPLNVKDRAQRCIEGFLLKSSRQLPGTDNHYRPPFSCSLLPNVSILYGQGMMARWECGDLTSRAILAWLSMREITGDMTTGRKVEAGQRSFLLSIINPDTGLVFIPELSDQNKGNYKYHSWDQSRTLRALVRWFQTTPAERDKIKPLIARMIQGLDEFSDIRGTDKIWGPYACWSADEFDHEHNPVPHPFSKEAYPNIGELIPDPAGSCIEGLVMYAELTDDAKAVDLAVRFTNGELGQHRADKFSPDQKKFSGFSSDGSFAGHLHSKTTTLIGIVKLARYLAVHNKLDESIKYLRQVKKSYDWMLANNNPTRGSRIGWFPERPRVGSSETCGTADMVELAAAMASCAPISPEFYNWAGLSDDVESITVNLIAHMQIRNTPEFKKLLNVHLGNSSADQQKLLDKLDGTWPSCVLPNDLAIGDNPTIPLSGCCQYAGVRALYSGWHNAMIYDDGKLRVNYFLNRSSQEAEMKTSMPEKGNAEIILRKSADVFIRVPGWLDCEDMLLTIDGRKINIAKRLDQTKHYIKVGRCPPRTSINISFPLKEYITTENIAGIKYTMTWRGNYIVKMDPAGRHFPFFP